MQTISPQRLHELLRQTQAVDLIDVRSATEYERAHIEVARLIPLSSLTPDAVRSSRRAGESDPVYVICQSGGRSHSACRRLQAAGINAINVAGGTSAWIKAGLPVVTQEKSGGMRRLARPAATLMALICLVLGFALHPIFLFGAAVSWFAMVATTGCPFDACAISSGRSSTDDADVRETA